MSQPKVSVIMGIYNCEATLAAAIESILTQTYENLELILCDDGSTDGTYEIAKHYADADSRVFLLKNDRNRRLAYTLNHCLSVATGEYVARMDADDISLPTRLEKQVAYLETHPDCQVVGTALRIWDGEKEGYVRRYPGLPKDGSPLRATPFAHPTVLMRKSTYDALGGYRVSPETMRAEDLDLWFRFQMAGFCGTNLEEPLYLYRESLTDYKKRTLKAAFGIKKVYTRYYKAMKAPLSVRLAAWKPILSALLPASLMARYHQKHRQVNAE